MQKDIDPTLENVNFTESTYVSLDFQMYCQLFRPYIISKHIHQFGTSNPQIYCYLTDEAETKWTPFRRRYFQTHFHEWKY